MGGVWANPEEGLSAANAVKGRTMSNEKSRTNGLVFMPTFYQNRTEIGTGSRMRTLRVDIQCPVDRSSRSSLVVSKGSLTEDE